MSDDPAVSTETEEREPGSTHSSAHELGDITGQWIAGGLQELEQTVGAEGDAVDYYRFTLSESREVRLGLKLREGEAELSVEDAEGNVLARSVAFGTHEAAVRTLLPGTYYVRVEAVGTVASEYEFKYGVLEADASYRPTNPQGWYAGTAAKLGMPSFEEAGYGFELSESSDGRVSAELLGTVLAVDPTGEELSYRIVGGNGSQLFAIDGASGELSYVGGGEDYESGVTSHELTVRASDGTQTVDTTVTVTITDAAEAPAFSEEGYAFALTENVDGSVNQISLGVVEATDPDGDAVRYRLAGDNESELFAIDATSGELSYVGAGEDFESGVTSHELTVRASDGTHTIETTVTVTITDAAEGPAFREVSYAFALAENTDGSVNRLSLGTVTATDPDSDTVRYSLLGDNDSDLFAIGETSGELYYVGAGEDYESGVTSYELTVRASDAAHTVDTTVMVTVTDEGEAPAFAEESYAFELAENVDGRVNRLSLGTVTDPDSDTVRYSLLDGNDSSLFAIEETSGELFYVGAGEDYESGVTSHKLTVRASDAAHTVDTTVTVTVTDEAEAPAFGDESYAFELAENADGRTNGLSLGRVTATDPDGDEVRYRLTGGNESELFAIDATSGELFYVGAGEDFESGVTSHELTVLASDGTHAIETTVTVTITDAAEGPAFREVSYAFALAENTDGSVNRLSLGTVTATDPNSDTVRYSLLGGNDSDLFAIDETSGELYYVGAGEDFEGGVTSYELTVRASDGTHASDTTVTVALGDVRGRSEPEGGDLPQDRTTAGLVLVDEGAVTGNIESTWDLDWFAVQFVAGRTYRIDFRGQPTGDGTLVDPFLYGVFDGDGRLIRGTTIPDGGTSYNSRLVFTAPGEGTYYIATSGNGTHPSGTGTYELEVRDVRAPVFAEAGYRFALTENAEGSVNRQSLGTVTATDPDGGTVRYRLEGGNESRRFAIDPDTGEVFYVGPGEDYESRVTSHELTVRASDGAYSTQVSVTVTVTDAPEAPAFAAESYAFELAENVDGSERLSLGVVEAVDPDGDPVHYSLASGNASDLFAIDAASGELYYIGSGEDFESGVTSHELTVGASDGAYSTEVTVTVTVTDDAEAPAFSEESYAFALAENANGSVNRLSLGAVLATDPDGDEVRYSLAGGNASDLFAINEASGELYYVGLGEDFESDTGPYELTVRASDGSHTVDTTVTVTEYQFNLEKTTRPQGSSEPVGDDLPAGRETSGEVRVNAEPVEGTLRSPSDRDWFVVTLAPGRTYVFALEGDTPRGGTDTAPAIRGLRDSNGDPVAGIVGGTEVQYATDAAAAEAVYYIEVGGEGGSGQGTSATRGVGTRSLATRGIVDTLGSGDGGTGYRLRAHDITETRDAADDYRSDISTTGVVTVGGSVTGEIERPGDRDWFALTLQAGRTYRIDLKGAGTGAGNLEDPYLRGIYDTDGNLIGGTTDDDAGRGFSSQVYFKADANDTYYVAAGSNWIHDGTYTLSVEDVTDIFGDDYALDVGTATRLTVGQSTNGRLDFNGDRDWFAVTLETGKTYRFDLEGSATRAGALGDPYILGIYDADGNLIRGTTDGGGGSIGNSRVFYTADANAIYYVAAGGEKRGNGTYTLSVAEVPDDYAASTSTTGMAMVGGAVAGAIDYAGDRDWFAITLEAGTHYRFELKGHETGDGTLWLPIFHDIYDADGIPLDGTMDHNGNTSPREELEFIIPDKDGIYYMAVRSRDYFAPLLYDTGTYKLSVTEVVDDYASDTGTTGTVEVGGTVAGAIDYTGDRDWFRVTLDEGKTYRFDLMGHMAKAGTLLGKKLGGIYDTDGNRMADVTDNNGWPISQLVFAAEANADYYVSAQAFWGDVGTYTLSVEEVTDGM